MFNKKTIIIVLIVTHYSLSYVSAGKILKKIGKIKTRLANKIAPPVVNQVRKPDPRPPALVTIRYDKELAGSYEEQRISWAPKMTQQQLESTKKFFNKLMDDQKKAEKGIPLPYHAKGMKVTKLSEIPKPIDEKDLYKIDDDKDDYRKTLVKKSSLDIAGIDSEEVMHELKDENQLKDENTDVDEEPQQPHSRRYKRYKRYISNFRSSPSAGTVFIDQVSNNIFPIGDPYGGAPDGILSMGKWCIELFVKGALTVIYSVVRWPHKILSKLMILVAAIGVIPHTLFWCLNPISIAQFVSKSIIINKNFDDMAAIQYRLKVRTANIVDKVHGLREMQEQGCCAYLAFKMDLYEVVEESGKDFIMHWMNAFFKLNQIVYCGEYIDGTGACDSVKFDESDPMRVIPRGPIPLWMELFAKYF